MVELTLYHAVSFSYLLFPSFYDIALHWGTSILGWGVPGDGDSFFPDIYPSRLRHLPSYTGAAVAVVRFTVLHSNAYTCSWISWLINIMIGSALFHSWFLVFLRPFNHPSIPQSLSEWHIPKSAHTPDRIFHFSFGYSQVCWWTEPEPVINEEWSFLHYISSFSTEFWSSQDWVL